MRQNDGCYLLKVNSNFLRIAAVYIAAAGIKKDSFVSILNVDRKSSFTKIRCIGPHIVVATYRQLHTIGFSSGLMISVASVAA